MTPAPLVRALLAALLLHAPPAMAGPDIEIIDYADLDGWADDDHAAALSVFRKTCMDIEDPEWAPVCALAHQAPGARSFFEMFFRPVIFEPGQSALFTGYYEPELNGALRPDGRFRYPIYAKPHELVPGRPWYTRAEIESGIIAGRGLEIAWLDDPVDVFFLHVQGSGRIRLPDGRVMRVGYAAKNGHEYRSVGRELVRRGVFRPHQVSAQVIRNWVRRNPRDGRDLLHHNPSFVFFRKLRGVDEKDGPPGAMNRPITAMRTIAVDPAFTPLGAPVWLETDGKPRLRRLMVAQDTGSAIKGAQRADIFFGSGEAAGRAAGTMRDPGRMIVLLPIEIAYRLAPGG
ncbi:murein transglycosylase [Maritimibacter sp. 55A14]|uniref:murein transglycosylase A n=1 Tax=Maritimibacter sp. 55A14 TaxID=2174844 RepID=UPI000D61C615|nr:murein transglycosylase A [Maritimibacter sp. 55A14]PWE33559.1 murein transglycosylase [Maritimibacter sp. 55A14]